MDFLSTKRRSWPGKKSLVLQSRGVTRYGRHFESLKIGYVRGKSSNELESHDANAKAACAWAVKVGEAHSGGSRLTALYCFEGEIKFCPTLFDGAWKTTPYIPDIIDLRQPKV